MRMFDWFRKAGEEQRNLEDPAYPLSDPLHVAFENASAPADSGVRVNASTVKAYAPVWRATNLLAGDVAKLSAITYKRVGERGKERAPEHPAFRLLRYRANPLMSALVFKRLLTAHALIHGNGYALIDRSPSGIPLGLFPLNPEATSPREEQGTIIYETTLSNGVQLQFAPSQVFHVMGPSSDGVKGDSVVSNARNSWGLGLAQQSYANRFFKNNTAPATVLEHPLKLSPEARAYLESSLQKFRGVSNAHKMLIAEEGAKLSALGMNNQDAQFLESREFQIKEVANWFGVPPHRLGSEERSSFASLAEENQSYLDSGLDPWLCVWEAEGWMKLLSLAEQDADSHLVEFDTRGLARTNMDARFQAYNTAIMGGWMSRNEARAAENLNEVDGLDEYYIPLNVTTQEEKQANQELAGQIASQEPQDAPGGDEEEDGDENLPAERAAAIAARDAIDRMCRRVHLQGIKKAANPKAYQEWVEGLMRAERWAWGNALMAPCQAAGWIIADYVEPQLEAASEHYRHALDLPVSQLKTWVIANPYKYGGEWNNED